VTNRRLLVRWVSNEERSIATFVPAGAAIPGGLGRRRAGGADGGGDSYLLEPRLFGLRLGLIAKPRGTFEGDRTAFVRSLAKSTVVQEVVDTRTRL